MSTSRNFLRPQGAEARVTNIELFFDLVFVYAVTQLSHVQLKELTLAAAGRDLLLFLAVWWAWIYTAWVTNWLDPDRQPVRLFVFLLSFAALVLAVSIPDAFTERGLAFAGAYVFIQVGRSLFVLWALGDADPANTRNFQRICVWLGTAAVLWIAGASLPGVWRVALWMVALAIEYAGPMVGFGVPRLGRSTTDDWKVEGRHMAERCSQFVIIALGESLVITGTSLGEQGFGPATLAAFAVAFCGNIAMWWIYFDSAAERGTQRIAASTDPGGMARFAYTYVHGLIVAGIILAAVAVELVLAHPTGHALPPTTAAVFGSMALFLVGNLLFRRAIAGFLPLSHLVGLALLALLWIASGALSPVWLGAGAAAILFVVALWEGISLGRSGGAALPVQSREGQRGGAP